MKVDRDNPESRMLSILIERQETLEFIKSKQELQGSPRAAGEATDGPKGGNTVKSGTDS